MKNPKKLNLYEMWDLYLLLGNGFGEKYLIDEVVLLLKSAKRGNIKKSLDLMYKNFSVKNPLEYSLLLIRGLKKNNFFDFQDFMEKLSGRS